MVLEIISVPNPNGYIPGFPFVSVQLFVRTTFLQTSDINLIMIVSKTINITLTKHYFLLLK